MTDELAPKVIVALLFAISFALIGWTAPVLYATHAPAEQFIEVHHFDAQDTPPSAEYHYICFDRSVHEPSSATVYTELFLITDDGRRIEVGGESADRYFQDGRQRVVTRIELPSDLEAGTYRYALVAELQLADGRVERDFQYESQRFKVDPDAEQPRREDMEC